MSDDEIIASRVDIPACICAKPNAQDADFTHLSRSFAVEVTCSWHTNDLANVGNGRLVLTGWARTAARRITVFVDGVRTEEAAVRAVRTMERDLASGSNIAFLAIPKVMLSGITGLPISFRIHGTPRIIDRARPRNLTTAGDILDQIRDAIRRKIAVLEQRSNELLPS